MNCIEIQFDSEDSNDVPLKLSAAGRISLSDITAATIGNLSAEWNDDNNTEPISVLRPWEDKASAEEAGNQTYNIDVVETGTRHHHSYEDPGNNVNIVGGEAEFSQEETHHHHARNQTFSVPRGTIYSAEETGTSYLHGETESEKLVENVSNPQNISNINLSVNSLISSVPNLSVVQNVSEAGNHFAGSPYVYSPTVPYYCTQGNGVKDQFSNSRQLKQETDSDLKVKNDNCLEQGVIFRSTNVDGDSDSTLAPFHRKSDKILDQTIPVPENLHMQKCPDISSPWNLNMSGKDSNPGPAANTGSLYSTLIQLSGTSSHKYAPIAAKESNHSNSGHMTDFRGVLSSIQQASTPMKNTADHSKAHASNTQISGTMVQMRNNQDSSPKNQRCEESFIGQGNVVSMATKRPLSTQRGPSEIYEIARKIDSMNSRQMQQHSHPGVSWPHEDHDNFIKRQKMEQRYETLDEPYLNRIPLKPVQPVNHSNKIPDGCNNQMFMNFLNDISKRMASISPAPVYKPEESRSPLHVNLSENITHYPPLPNKPLLDPSKISISNEPSIIYQPRSESSAMDGYHSNSGQPKATARSKEPPAMTDIMKSVENFNNALVRIQSASPVLKPPASETSFSTPNAKGYGYPELGYLTQTPVQNNKYGHPQAPETVIQSPGVDSRYTDSLFSHLGSPLTNTADNKCLGDLKALLSSECKKEVVPQTLFKMHIAHDNQSVKENVFTRERCLQDRFDALKNLHPEEIGKLSSFFRYQSALIETDRFRTLHECQYPQSYKKSVNEHFDEQLHRVMDRVERSVELIEQADKENQRTKVSKSRPHLSRGSIEMMERWYAENIDHPYPTAAIIDRLADSGNIGVEQVKKWFANKRNRSQNTRTLTEIAMKKRKLGQLMN